MEKGTVPKCARCTSKECRDGKDRVLAHNPAAAIYCQYIRKRFGKTYNGDA